MEAKELRIWNLLFDRFGKTVIVESINELGINLNGGDGNGVYPFFEFKELKPIPLTEEWRLNFGFENNQLSFGFFTIEYSEENKVFYLNDIGLKLDYVHQLQNLYFALTNEELTVNL